MPPRSAAWTPLSMDSCPRGRPHATFFQNGDRGGQGSGPEHDGQVPGFLLGETAGDAGPAAGNALLDDRRGIHLAVQDDGQTLLDVFARKTFEEVAPPPVEGHAHVCLVERVEVDLGVGDVFTRKQRVLAQHHGPLSVTAVGVPLHHETQFASGRQHPFHGLFPHPHPR